MRDERRKDEKEELSGRDATPPARRDLPLETPFYEEQLDPYFTPGVRPDSEDESARPDDPEEESYWREPDSYWLEEGMWPWPEPRPRRREEWKHPEHAEPQ